jgi:hypothetical protein
MLEIGLTLHFQELQSKVGGLATRAVCGARGCYFIERLCVVVCFPVLAIC